MSILKEIQWLLYKIKKSKNIVNSKFTIVVWSFTGLLVFVSYNLT